MRRPVTDIALLAYIAKKNAKVVSYTEATKACRSSSSASRALHQLIGEGILEPKPKLLGFEVRHPIHGYPEGQAGGGSRATTFGGCERQLRR